jgi:hypothetical protein
MAKKAAAVVEEDLELEELDEDVEEEAAKKSKTPDIEFGVKDLCEHLEKLTGKKYTTRDIRTQIRKMAREDKPRVKREIVAGNRTRYDWKGGLENSEVKRIIAAVTGGEVEANKKEALAKLKETQAKKKGTKAGKKGKKAKVVEEDIEDDDEDIEEDDE